ncbi:hypothetical protein BpHYR1_020102 [Brachionus plicatilis]|uniref:Uncharacterized protein n=1 Tax=Brachionus plicatilis TaxID=10195 RepID=A0A3M7QPF8_BRAPC|nr:hypothetical protein BpHYR1_020102 [Brachionus plicatilis]
MYGMKIKIGNSHIPLDPIPTFLGIYRIKAEMQKNVKSSLENHQVFSTNDKYQNNPQRAKNRLDR